MKIEVRADNTVKISGYVNAVERFSRKIPSPKGEFIEQIRAGTFAEALKENTDVKILLDHNWNRELGSIKEGNLSLKEDAIGLRADAILNDPEVVQLAKDGKLKGWSFGMAVRADEWENVENGVDRRTISKLRLSEVSLINRLNPFYTGTSVEARGETTEQVEERAFTDEVETTIEEVKEQPDQHEENRANIDLEIATAEIELLKLGR